MAYRGGGANFGGGSVVFDPNALDVRLGRIEDAIADMLRRDAPYAPGSMAGTYDRQGGISPVGYLGGNNVKGGIVTSDILTVPDDTVGGTTLDIVFSDEERGRATGMTVCYLLLQLSPGSTAGGALIREAMKAGVTMFNGKQPLSMVNEVPLPFAVSTPGGFPNQIPVFYSIPTDTAFNIELDIRATLTGTAGESTLIQALLLTSDRCGNSNCGASPCTDSSHWATYASSC